MWCSAGWRWPACCATAVSAKTRSPISSSRSPRPAPTPSVTPTTTGDGPGPRRFKVHDDRVVLVVRDEGGGFDEDDDQPARWQRSRCSPSEGGMGISIIRAVVDEFRSRPAARGRHAPYPHQAPRRLGGRGAAEHRRSRASLTAVLDRPCDRLCCALRPRSAQVAALERYLDLLSAGGARNVTGVRDRRRSSTTLIGDSLALLDVPSAAPASPGSRWVDLGAGAGIPGIPLAVALPAFGSRCSKSVGKKCAFLEAAVAAAGLAARAHVVCARSERTRPLGARAGARGSTPSCWRGRSAPLPTVVELAAPLLAPGRRAGRQQDERGGADEGRRAARPRPRAAASPLRGFASRCRARRWRTRSCVVSRRSRPTPDWLPRPPRAGAAKRPLGWSTACRRRRARRASRGHLC